MACPWRCRDHGGPADRSVDGCARGTWPLTAYPILKKLGKFNQADAGAIAAHYGSVSAVTFAVGIAFLEGMKETPRATWS